MQISSSLSSALSSAMPRIAGAKPSGSQVPFAIAQARADSAEDKRRLEENEARHADAIAGFAAKGMTMTQGSYTMLYKQEVAKSIDTDGDGIIGVDELAAGLGGDEGMERAKQLHSMLDVDGDGRLGLEEFGDSVRDPFRDADFRRQLDRRGAMDPAAMGALHRRHAAQYDAAAVLGAMVRAIDTAA
ncbi:EF-hand domain-containing protein [Massilia sp. CFBP9012]|uniref:EF-hand domain-containing protein n=1 Tax=Massilia sp. CFBP9012 TaxID=3096531 RepID=UPI002A6AE438|nr:EF-hand domain-containing protein [Massilia sp. CFBP9012]MDY0977585.1 EF-hand domain-containing protein [Massilia sp. CFBP9012]